MEEQQAPGRRRVRSGTPPTGGTQEAPPPGQPEDKRDERYPAPWGSIITQTVRLDVAATFRRLESELTLGDSLGDYGAVLVALDRSTRNAYDAARLVRAAKIVDDDFKIGIGERREAMRTEARRLLDAEKAAAKKADPKAAVKAPTLQEVEDKMTATWPDECRSLQRREGEMHGAFRAIEGLERAWWDRCQTLRKISDRQNGNQG